MNMKNITKQAIVYGIVQGVGFRPTVSRHAQRFQVKGSVCNKGPYVEIYAQGHEEKVDSFLHAVRIQAPRRAVILKMDIKEISNPACFYEDFSIVESEKVKGQIFLSPDIAICDKCKEEMYDPNNRRYRHPFINCTSCGPRLTILDSMPYDRPRTSMAAFLMCKECKEEYYDSESRRYDAQPICCNDCGPEVSLLDENVNGSEAIRIIRQAICQGQIVAIKGIGGFHLCCDAGNEEAVSLLRKRKKRPAKPFAVMMRDMETIQEECRVTDWQKEILDGHQKPIILLERKEQGKAKVCSSVAPDNPKLGVMLPYAPIHLLLFDHADGLRMPDCLVMTSANTSGAPICRDDDDARRELFYLCDHILTHNRLIRLRADDSVMDSYEEKPYMIRRSRGYAPLPFALDLPWQGEVVAMGGELKNTFCYGKDHLLYPSPYLGDMEDLRSVQALEESLDRMGELLEAQPTLIACDMHPGYNTRILAGEYARKKGISLLEVQHHYAHILSCMVENDVKETVIGVSYDGTGYGTDGSVWGGEIMVCHYGGFERKASIEPFDQVGGDLASKEGWRNAVSILKDCYGSEKAVDLVESLGICEASKARLLVKMAENGINTVESTSAGRLFDAVSALLGIRNTSSFEGEASCQLQYAAERGMQTFEEDRDAYEIFAEKIRRLEVRYQEDRILMPTKEIIKAIVEALGESRNVDCLALWFHKIFAELTVKACGFIRKETGVCAVALSGGVYQNTLFLEECVKGLEEEGFRVYCHSLLPPNDGGICVGQAAAALYHLQDA